MLRSVMVNLLGNAWKYTQNRAVARIEMGIDRQNGREVYFIRDNGAGFNPSQAEKIFQPFQRVHHDISFQGNGIGLATVQRIVELHQGRIWAESGEGKGAVFYFILGPGDLAPNA